MGSTEFFICYLSFFNSVPVISTILDHSSINKCQNTKKIFFPKSIEKNKKKNSPESMVSNFAYEKISAITFIVNEFSSATLSEVNQIVIEGPESENESGKRMSDIAAFVRNH